MGHEYVHVSQYAAGLTPNSAAREGGAYQWEMDILSKAGMKETPYYRDAKYWFDMEGGNMVPIKARPYYKDVRWNLPIFLPNMVK